MTMKNQLRASLLAAICGVASTPLALAADMPHWTYDEQAHWGDIPSEDPLATGAHLYPYAVCDIGGSQSPIDISAAKLVHPDAFNALRLVYASALQPTYLNNGHAAQVKMATDYPGVLRIGKDEYPLLQFHFHAPSEHKVDGVVHAAELHFVHIRQDGKMAVVGVFLDEGAENRTIGKILKSMPATSGSASGPALNPMALLPAAVDRQSFYTYGGSLTTPPCTEGVNWYVLATPITLSTAQLDQLKAIYDGNARDAGAARTVTSTLP
ncbi:carbonic anhydrase [Methylomagnum ishizawai]|uniref:Carbonic anhydrase n=1 Tax=Methylomagnum ishizawai TaxID=1760988 RepID=A0A1Y6CZB2_9GAMM|nr:carbonic anhydrase family protein [Methylomagnum ishizawai]SMF95560.1 carbonic anhydrase [Methylomagnum ishizawai]